MALNFDNSTDYHSYANQTNYGITADISLAAWIKRDATGSVYDGIVAKTDGGATWDYDLIITDAGGDVNKINFYSDTTGNILSTALIDDTNWHHVCFSRIGSAITFYKDGVAGGTATDGTALNNNADPITVGTDGPTWDAKSYFGGNLAFVQVYNRGLTAGEVKHIMFHPMNPLGALPVLNATLQDTSGADHSGNSITATVNGTPVTADNPYIAPPYGYVGGWPGAFTAVAGVTTRRYSLPLVGVGD